MDYFTADIHEKHNAVFVFGQRGFKNADEHDEAIIKGINDTVGVQDILWILGDVSWKDPIAFLCKINCENINIIKGNHDGSLYRNKHLVPKSIKLHEDIVEICIEGRPIVLCHFPMVSWNKSHWGSWHLFGHKHLQELPIKGKMFDVAPSAEHINPYSFDEIKEIMETLPDNWDLIRR